MNHGRQCESVCVSVNEEILFLFHVHDKGRCLNGEGQRGTYVQSSHKRHFTPREYMCRHLRNVVLF